MRVRRRRGIHVLMGTLALVAGCSTAQRAEVSGVVRDRATGRVIAGARVVGTDGSLAETDADGRFHLYVHGAQPDVRISAAGHASEELEIDGLEASVDLAPIDESWGQAEVHTHVVRFVEETWTLDGGVSDGSTSTLRACTETSLAQAHSEIVGGDELGPAADACASCHGQGAATSSCVTCHDAEARALEGVVPTTAIAPHAALGGGCLACHSESASHGDERTSCARCHGGQASTRRAEIGHFYALATSATLDRDLHGTRFELRSTRQPEVSAETVATWARALARDPSGGAHDPRTVLTLGRLLTE